MISDNQKFNKTIQPNSAFLKQLKDKLPEFFGKNDHFNLDKFKSELKEYNINELKDGYQLNFIGKDYARRQAGELPTSVIVPDEKQNNGEGKNSQNIFFTGDNLEVLRHLQSAYANKIDVIYIDPPYNTGQDEFSYPDHFEYGDDKLKEMFTLNDDQIKQLKTIQGQSSHSAWLAYMYPRIFLAKKMLKSTGSIFVSIDDNEDADLFLLLQNIFGENSFVNRFIWTKTSTPPSLSKKSRQTTEYVITFEKNKNTFKKYFGSKVENLDASLLKKTNSIKELTIPAGAAKFSFMKSGIIDPNVYKGIELLNRIKVDDNKNLNDFTFKAHSVWSQDNLIEEIRKGTTILFKTTDLNPRYLRESNLSYKAPNTNLNKEKALVGTNEDASKHLIDLGFPEETFTNPKPVSLIKYLIKMVSYLNKEAIVMDFFAGSATTAEAVMQQNIEDNGHRKFIMVQLPEKTYHMNKDGNKIPTKGGKAAFQDGFMSIDEIAQERIRRAAKKIKQDNELTLPENFDGSFKHYRVVKPTKQILEDIENFDPNGTDLFTNMVDSFSSSKLNVDGNATGEQTILTTWLVQDGYSFEADIETFYLGEYKAHIVENHRLYLINEGWNQDDTKELLNQLGTHQLDLQSVVVFGYSFNIAELRELEIGLKQLDSHVNLIRRY